MSKKADPDQLALSVCAAYGSHVTEREKEFSRHGFLAGWQAAKRRMPRKKIMRVLDQVLEEGGYKLTVRSYNKILTGLGYRLGRY
jgi:hypothetical protein